jgi:hypothetical protein
MQSAAKDNPEPSDRGLTAPSDPTTPPSLSPETTSKFAVDDVPAGSTPTKFSSPFAEWRDSTFKRVSDTKSYWKDRQAILLSPTILRNSPALLKNSPFKFAFNGLILPSLIIGLLYSAFGAIYPLPPPQIDRVIDEQKNLQKILDDALHNPTLQPAGTEPAWARQMSTDDMKREVEQNTHRLEELHAKQNRTAADEGEIAALKKRTLELVPVFVNRTMSDLQPGTIAAQKETVTNQLNLSRIKKFVNVLNGWQSFIVGLSLLMAAYLFGWLVRRMRPPAPFASAGRDAYLYLIGAALVLPNLLVALLNLALDLSSRFDVDWFLRIHPFLIFLIAAWAIVIALRVGRMLTEVLGDPLQKTNGKAQRRVTWRLVFSQIIVGMAIQVLVALIGLPVFWVISKFQKLQ